MPETRARWAGLALVAIGVQVGAAMVATRIVVDDLGPATIAAVRYAIAVLTLLPFVARGGQPMRIAAHDRAPIIALGIGQFGVLIWLLNAGLASVPAGLAALLFACFPLLALAFAVALGRERLRPAKLLAAGLALTGVAVALGPAVRGPVTGIAGPAWVLAAAAVGALCSVLVQPYLARYPALTVGFWAMLASVAVLALAAAVESAPARLMALGPAGWMALVFVGCSSGVGYWLWLWALSRAPASRVTLSLALSPLTALTLGTLALGEPLSLRLLIALALIGAALAAR